MGLARDVHLWGDDMRRRKGITIGVVAGGLLLVAAVLASGGGCTVDYLDECLFEGQACIPSDDDDGAIDEPSCCQNLRCQDFGMDGFQCTVAH